MTIKLDYNNLEVTEFLDYLNFYKKAYENTYPEKYKDMEVVLFHIKSNNKISEKDYHDIMWAFDDINFIKNFIWIIWEKNHLVYVLFRDILWELIKDKKDRDPIVNSFMEKTKEQVKKLLWDGDKDTVILPSDHIITIEAPKQTKHDLNSLKCWVIDRDSEYNYFISSENNNNVLVSYDDSTIDYALYKDNTWVAYIKLPWDRTMYKIWKDVKKVEQIWNQIKVTYTNWDTLIIDAL